LAIEKSKDARPKCVSKAENPRPRGTCNQQDKKDSFSGPGDIPA